jgi:glutathione peroxidase-family protein
MCNRETKGKKTNTHAHLSALVFVCYTAQWNFTKFLLDADGKVVKRFSPTDSPLSFVKDIEALLNKA